MGGLVFFLLNIKSKNIFDFLIIILQSKHKAALSYFSLIWIFWVQVFFCVNNNTFAQTLKKFVQGPIL